MKETLQSAAAPTGAALTVGLTTDSFISGHASEIQVIMTILVGIATIAFYWTGYQANKQKTLDEAEHREWEKRIRREELELARADNTPSSN